MSIKEEFIFDFAVNLPRVMVCENVIIVDYVKHIITYSPDEIVLNNGKRYTRLRGKNMMMKEIRNERVLITGELEAVEFPETLYTTDS